MSLRQERRERAASSRAFAATWASLSRVLLALTVPAISFINPSAFLERRRYVLCRFDQAGEKGRMCLATENVRQPCTLSRPKFRAHTFHAVTCPRHRRVTAEPAPTLASVPRPAWRGTVAPRARCFGTHAS